MGHSGRNATKCATSASMHDYKNKLPNAAINLCRWSLPRKSLTTQPRGRGSLEGRALGPASLWRAPGPKHGSGGNEMQVLESLAEWSTFCVAANGISYIPS